MLKIQYIIKSGDGFLLFISGKMIANQKDPLDAAILAKRYNDKEIAEKDCKILRDRGLEANVIELHIGMVDNT